MDKSRKNEEYLRDWRDRRKKVYRITVDEKLTDDDIRLVVCILVRNVEDYMDKEKKQIVITDRQHYWDEEREFHITRRNFKNELARLGLQPVLLKQLSWENFKEGQVYLMGNFRAEEVKVEIKKEKVVEESQNKNKKKKEVKVLKRFIFDPGQQNFEQINTMVQETIERLYFSVLKGRGRHAGAD